MLCLVWPVAALSAGCRRQDREPAVTRACIPDVSALSVNFARTFGIFVPRKTSSAPWSRISGVARAECSCG